MLIKRPDNSECVICGKLKPQRYWVCKPCAVQWGLYNKNYKTWPSWVRFLINEKRKELYRESGDVEIPVDPDWLDTLISEDFIYQNGYFTRS